VDKGDRADGSRDVVVRESRVGKGAVITVIGRMRVQYAPRANHLCYITEQSCGKERCTSRRVLYSVHCLRLHRARGSGVVYFFGCATVKGSQALS